MMTPGETGGNTIFYFIQPRRGATKIISSQRRRDLPAVSQAQRNPPAIPRGRPLGPLVKGELHPLDTQQLN